MISFICAGIVAFGCIAFIFAILMTTRDYGEIHWDDAPPCWPPADRED